MADKNATMSAKEKNYVSAVIYLGDEKASVQPFLKMLCAQLGSRFSQYELVFAEDASRDGSVEEVRAFLEQMEDAPPVTMIHLSVKQGLELAMNAGLDMAVGDFVYEFDSMAMPYPEEMVLQAYDACLAGNDIVTVVPHKNRGPATGLFYKFFNSSSRSKYKLRTDAFRLLSRRAINRVHAISPAMPYRKAAYAASGLRLKALEYTGAPGAQSEHLRVSRALDSLVLYTGFFSRLSFIIAGVMLGLMLLAVVYTLLVNLTGIVPEIAPGWTTTMLLLTGGFFGLFVILAIVLKYLSVLVELVFRRQTYLVENVEKLN